MKRILGLVVAMAFVALGLSGCDGKAKQDLAKCQADAAKMSAELNAAKGELDTVKKELADTKGKFEALGKEKESLSVRVAELEATLAAAQAPAPEPAKAPAKKPAAKKAPEPQPEVKRTSTGAPVPTVGEKAKGAFRKKK